MATLKTSKAFAVTAVIAAAILSVSSIMLGSMKRKICHESLHAVIVSLLRQHGLQIGEGAQGNCVSTILLAVICIAWISACILLVWGAVYLVWHIKNEIAAQIMLPDEEEAAVRINLLGVENEHLDFVYARMSMGGREMTRADDDN